jgi:anti-sigma B factor antagonist
MLEVSSYTKQGATIVQIKGDVDLYSSPQVRSAIMELTEKKTPAILVDLRDVGYMDSSGVATLVEGLQQVGRYGGKFKLMHLASAVREVFELSRLDKVFEIYEDEESALNSLKA